MKLKECGFDLPCYYYFTRRDSPEDCVWHTTSEEAPIDYNRSIYADCSMPLLSQAQKWLREKHLFFIYVRPCVWHKNNIVFDVAWSWVSNDGFKYDRRNNFKTYEEALSFGIKWALELIGKEGKDECH